MHRFRRPSFLSFAAIGIALCASPGGGVRAQTADGGPLPALPAISVYAPDAFASEQGPDKGLYHIVRQGPTNTEVRVPIRMEGSASNGVDYAMLPGHVVFRPGVRKIELPLVPVDDSRAEPTETATLVLVAPPSVSNATYIVVDPRRATVSIADNDLPAATNRPPVVTVRAVDAEAAETPDGTNPGGFAICRSGPYSNALDVFVRWLGTASNGVDYAELAGVVTVPAGHEGIKVAVRPIDDSLPEPPESVVLRLLPPAALSSTVATAAYVIGSPAEAVVKIADNDTVITNVVPVVGIKALDPVAAEGTNFCRWIGWPRDALRGPESRTNTACFAVIREGATNAPLSVRYHVGGTASNGADYAALPGWVVIPAGQRLARILVTPVDDDEVERLESVILRLVEPPTAGVLPPYRLARQRQAAAVIVDNDRERPESGPLPDRCIHVQRPAANGELFVVGASTNLLDWEVVCTNAVTDGAMHFVDPDAQPLPLRYYRLQPLPAVSGTW